MAARIAIVVVCCAAIAGLATRLREHDRCQSAQTTLNPATLTSDCRDPDAIASASALLLSAGERDQALRLARESVQREPDSFVGWVAMALALRDRDPAGAAAGDRARQGAQPALAGTASRCDASVAVAGGGRRRSLKRRIGRSTM